MRVREIGHSTRDNKDYVKIMPHDAQYIRNGLIGDAHSAQQAFEESATNNCNIIF